MKRIIHIAAGVCILLATCVASHADVYDFSMDAANQTLNLGSAGHGGTNGKIVNYVDATVTANAGGGNCCQFYCARRI